MKKNTIFLIGFITLVSVLLVLAVALNKNSNTKADMTVPPLPEVQLTDLFDQEKKVALSTLFKEEQYGLINVWGSWCQACAIEHDFLISIKNDLPIVGVNWYDEKEKALIFLERLGNPYQRVLQDSEGVFSVAMGLKGAPESFLVKGNRILAVHRGVLNERVWAEKFVQHLPTQNKVAP